MLLALLAPLAALLSVPPFVDPPGSLDYADRRTFFGIPNFMDVVSNLPYLLIGVAGVRAVLESPSRRSRPAWTVFFSSIALVSFGSAWFHWNPSSETIVWDRLPMVLAFTGLLTALLSDYVSERLSSLLIPAAIVGVASVLYGHAQADLRLYAWVQLLPLLAILAIHLYPAKFTLRGYLLLGFGCYVLAKVVEVLDRQILEITAGLVSGHTLKHLVSALGLWLLVVMVRRRTPLVGEKAPN